MFVSVLCPVHYVYLKLFISSTSSTSAFSEVHICLS